MQNLLIRGIPKNVSKALSADAERHRRSREKHALYLIEQALESRAAETGGELLDYYESAPPPKVDVKSIDSFLAQRGRRSSRPNDR
jgi:plasmid stability protein